MYIEAAGIMTNTREQVFIDKSKNRGLLMIQWLRLHDPNAGGQGSIPGQISHATAKSSHTTAKNPACHTTDQRCCMHLCTKTWSSQIHKQMFLKIVKLMSVHSHKSVLDAYILT